MPIEVLAVSAIGLILILFGIIFLMPGERKKIKKDKKDAEAQAPQKDFEQEAKRLQRHVQSLRDKILKKEKDEKAIEKELMVEKVKVRKLQEKLAQEREWHKKEQSGIDKKGGEFQTLKAELIKVGESFSKEHAANIRLERSLKESKEKNTQLNDQRRAAEGENAGLKTKNEEYRREISQLKGQVAQLSKKQEDTEWIAKPEYERVVELLKAKEKELARVQRDSKKEDAQE